jgi:hypothetical protein
MGAKEIQSAFNLTAAGKAVCTEAKLNYVDGAQVITLTGHDGVDAFEIQSEPFNGCPAKQAAKLALQVRAKQDPDHFMGLLPTLSYSEPELMKTNRTGLGGAIGTLRQEMEAAKQDALAASSEVQEAVTSVKMVSQEIRGVAKDMRDEAADARAALAQLTNGGPSLDD